LIGVLVSVLPEDLFATVRERLITLQHRLFTVGSNLAAVQMDLGKMPHIIYADVKELEDWIDEMEKDLQTLTQFILPGGHEAAAHAFVARAVCRRAERRLIDVADAYPELSSLIKQYLNRLSDALFVLARWINWKSGVPDVTWVK